MEPGYGADKTGKKSRADESCDGKGNNTEQIKAMAEQEKSRIDKVISEQETILHR